MFLPNSGFTMTRTASACKSPARNSGAPDRLVQARALILCALPYQPTQNRSVTRMARIGREAFLRVTFTSVDEGVPLAFGADRALLGWMQTRAYPNGFVAFDTLSEYFRDFGLGASGREYLQFRQRLRRIESLAITVAIDSPGAEARLRLHPLKKSLLPNSSGGSPTMSPGSFIRRRYGFELDPDFWRYLRANPVPLPLPLMRRFHNRPQAWDLAAFVLYRTYVAKSPAVIPWAELIAQLGSTDRYPYRLRGALDRVLAEVRGAYPSFPGRFLPGLGGLILDAWRPSEVERLKANR